jgi:hypothetical protein
MRKLLLATAMATFASVSAFAAMPLIAAGDVNLASTSASSNAGVASMQGTKSGVSLSGNGSVITGTVSGNYTSVQTGATGVATPLGSMTSTTATQVNVGGTVSAGNVSNSNMGHSFTSGSTGGSVGGQSSQATGTSSATASNTNLGGFVIATVPSKHK